MSDNKEIYSPVYGCNIPINNDKDKEICERYNSLYKEMKQRDMKLLHKDIIGDMKLLHKDIIELADKLYRFSDSLEMNNKEEIGIQKAILDALQNLNHVTEYLAKYTLSGE